MTKYFVMVPRMVRTYRRRPYYRRRFLRRFFLKRPRRFFRRYYRPSIRRPSNAALNTVMLRPNWTDNFLPTPERSRYLLSFKFNNLPELDKFKALFGYYRFLRFYTKVYPKVTVLDRETSSGTYIGVPWHRYMDDKSLQALVADDLLDLTHVKTRRCNQVMIINAVPAVMQNVNIVPNSTMKNVVYRPWIKIDTEGTAVEHFGILFAFPSDSIHIDFLVVTRLYVQLRGYAV